MEYPQYIVQDGKVGARHKIAGSAQSSSSRKLKALTRPLRPPYGANQLSEGRGRGANTAMSGSANNVMELYKGKKLP